MTSSYKVLIIDDDMAVLNICQLILSAEGLSTQTAGNGQAAFQALADNSFDLILLDIGLPDVDGLDILEQVSNQYSQISPIIMTGYATLEAAVRAQELGAEGFILKPFNDQKLLQVVRRVIERRRLREDYARLQVLVQTEKLSALGRLSASLAHEINNPLQALRSGLRLLRKPQLNEAKRRSYAAALTKEVERLIDITTRTLDFARPNQVGKKSTDLNQILADTIAMARKQLQHSQIDIFFELAPNLPAIQVVPNQIKQVFLNLILNAIDAMTGHGQLNVRISYTAPDPFVSVELEDNGCGMTPEVLNKIYEPFFSTKEAGTGLGLSISYSIVVAHGGRIEVESEPGVGSRFTVYLPLANAEEDNDRVASS